MSQGKVAIVGYGYWGKNVARVFSQSYFFELDTICDSDPAALQKAKKIYPQAKVVTSVQDIADDVDLVAVVAPASTHFTLGKYFLERGKHVMMSKPFTRNLEEADALFALAKKQDRVIFADHTFVFHPAVRKLKDMLHLVGQPHFLLSQRLNLGLYQPDVNVIYDLMPHDLSIICYLFDGPIQSAETVAMRAAGQPQEDLAHSTLSITDGVQGLLTVSWLSPFKVRQFFIVGSKGILVYDDTDVLGKVKFFDRGISVKEISGPAAAAAAYSSLISYRSGDLFSPAVPNEEALAFELLELQAALQQPAKRDEYNRLTRNVMVSLDKIVSGRKEWR